MASEKIDRKDLKHDPFQDVVFHAVGYVYDQRRWFISGALAALLIAGGVVGYILWDRYSSGVQSQAYFDAVRQLNDDKTDADLRAKHGGAALRSFVEAYPRSRLAPAAWLNLARLDWDQKQIDQAAAKFQRVLDHGSSTPEQRAVALSGLGRALETQGKYAEALALYNQLPDKPFADLKAANLARVAQLMGDTTLARSEYQKLVQGQAASSLSGWAKQALDFLP